MKLFKLTSFHRRSIACFLFVVALFSISIYRLFSIGLDEKYLNTATLQGTYSLKIYDRRGTIFDCNLEKLTDQDFDVYSVVSPSPDGIETLKANLDGENLEKYLTVLTKGNPVLINKELKNIYGGMTSVSVPKRYNNTATHLLGYTNSEGLGVSGIEGGMNDYLKNGGTVKVVFEKMANGTVVAGTKAQLIIENDNSQDVILTIDKRIQKIVESAMGETSVGAVVVMEANTGKIKAMVSNPTFDPYNLSASLESENSPFINRTLYSYNAGSVFKPFVAAAALENKITDYFCNCTGGTTIDNRYFKCHKTDGHGEMNLKTALEESCNCYFYGISEQIGAESLTSFLSNFRIESKINLGGGIITNSGKITNKNDLSISKSALANLSIGQGDLLISPVQMAEMYSAIVNDGLMHSASVIEGTVDTDGNTVYTEIPSPTKVMKKQTAEILKEYLISTVENGTGSVAKVDGAIIGGKTGTAQTGILDSENETSLNGWFCGFIEKPNTIYTIVVMCENAVSGSKDSGPIFKEIAESLYYLQD